MKTIHNFKGDCLSKEELTRIEGGREVYRLDLDGDGTWDLKIVVRNNGEVKCKSRWA